MRTRRSRNMTRLIFTVFLLIASIVSGRANAPSHPGMPWQASVEKDHPLVGKIWDASAEEYIDAATLTQRLTQGAFVLLGEKHDNPDHHRLQAWLLRALIAAGRRPTVGFEMFDIDDGAALAQHLAVAPTDAAGLAEVVNWGQSGWPDWALYQPIAEAALEAGVPIVATNLPRLSVQRVAREGEAALDPAFVERYGLAQPFAAEIQADMTKEMYNSHCGHASDEVIEAMIKIQRARDAQMADSLAAANRSDGAVLIAGVGHVRKDRGVPAYLALVAPATKVISLAFLEVKAGETEPAAYTPEFAQARPPFDYIWFTPRVDNLDPCEKFGKQLEQLKKHP